MKKLIALFAAALTLGLSTGVYAEDPPAAPAVEAAPAAEAAPAEAAAPVEAAAPAEAAAEAEPAPTVDKGDTAWMLVSTLLVVFMAVPGLALFYGGLVRAKNMLSVLMQVMVVFSLITVLWAFYGYTLAFTEGSPYIGSMSKLFLKGMTLESLADTFTASAKLPEFVFVAFQATFAGITCALIVGSFAERIRFSAVLLFSVLWFTFSYLPIAHMVWARAVPAGQGRWTLRRHGGAHQRRRGRPGGRLHDRQAHRLRQGIHGAHSLTLTMVGASMLWVGCSASMPAPTEPPPRGLAFLNTWCDGGGDPVLEPGRVDVQEQALHAGRRVRRGGGPGGHHSGLRHGGPHGRHHHRPPGGRDLPVGREWPEAHVGRRRLPGRVRRAWRGRHAGCHPDRRVHRPVPGRHRRGGLLHRQPGGHPGAGRGDHHRLVGVVAAISYKIVDIFVGLRVPEEEEREGLDITGHGESAYHI